MRAIKAGNIVTRVIVIREHGGPERLGVETAEVASPRAGEVLLRQTAIGVNYVDTYFRRGVYTIPLPAVLGVQGVGVVEARGEGVTRFAVGDTVAYGSSSHAYAESRVINADSLVGVPGGLSAELIAATLTRGMTAEYLLCRLHEVRRGEVVIVHAAAGGTGWIVCQWAKHLGAVVIGTAGSPEKCKLAREAGCDLVIAHDAPDFVAQVRDFTDGGMVDIVYDSIGKTSFSTSLECIKPRGLMVAYGNASGRPEPFDVLTLAERGSLFLTRPRLNEYVVSVDDLKFCTARFFATLERDIVRPQPIQAFALEHVADAHRHLEDRGQTAIPILVP